MSEIRRGGPCPKTLAPKNTKTPFVTCAGRLRPISSPLNPCENTPRPQSMAIHLKPRSLRTFQSRLLAWFRAHRRELPWRASRDPYRIWVAEIMLQQTRIAAVIPYYDRFLRRFPDVRTLARARQPEVLKFWSGLGYYSRARNLHAAAKTIVAEHNGSNSRETSKPHSAFRGLATTPQQRF